MMYDAALRKLPKNPDLPFWVPETVKTYLAHVEGKDSLREIARKTGCHASTIMRQVRKTEGLRDDPLADAALSTLENYWRGGVNTPLASQGKLISMSKTDEDRSRIDRDTMRALKALNEPGALLVVADGVEDAVVVVNGADDRPVRRAVVPREVAEIMALKEWISGQAKGRLARYAISLAGRGELNRLMAQAEQARVIHATDPAKPTRPGRTKRTAGAEPPLRVLARRRRADGEAFLAPDMVAAAERFRESFEIAKVSGALPEDLHQVLEGKFQVVTTATQGNLANAVPRGQMALNSLMGAVRALGPDLAETVILSCCNEAGMEEIEKQLDYPARSGKIVLRIALNRLKRHYEDAGDEDHGMIY